MFKKIIERISKSLDNRDNSGFSLLELVISVSILLLLTVGGIVGYNEVNGNARKAALQTAVNEVANISIMYLSDGNSSTIPQNAVDEWNAVSDTTKYYVEILPLSETGGILTVRATHPESGDYATKTITANP